MEKSKKQMKTDTTEKYNVRNYRKDAPGAVSGINTPGIELPAFNPPVPNRAAHVKTSTYFSLYLAKMLFDTPIPDEVLTALRPSKRKEKRILSLISCAGLLHPKAAKFSKLKFLRFQTSLYDKASDMLFVIWPKGGRIREIYGYKSPLKTPFYVIVRALDLVGIRKRKK